MSKINKIQLHLPNLKRNQQKTIEFAKLIFADLIVKYIILILKNKRNLGKIEVQG